MENFPSSEIKRNWPTANRSRPCPKCGHTDRCRIAPDGAAGYCWRSTEPQPWKTGPGEGRANGNGHLATHRKPRPATKQGATFPTAAAAITAAGRTAGLLAATWHYTDAAGEELMCVARFDAAGGKQFRPFHRNADGVWQIGDPSGPLPLYRLAEIAPEGVIYVVEGEKCADAAATLGITAITSAHGAQSAAKSEWAPLAGREVVILPDADAAGAKYAADVTRILGELTPPAKCKIVALPGLANGSGQDIADWLLADGRDCRDADELKAEISALAEAAPWIDTAATAAGPIVTCLADVEPREVSWLWPGRVPLGRITLLVGRPGGGKSYLSTDMAARVSTGSPWPDGTPCERGSVLFVAAEDDPADTIRPRLDAHQADVKRIHLMTTVRRISDEGKPAEVMFTLSDVAALETALQGIADCKLVVIDPVGSFLGGRIDSHKDSEVRSVLAPVAQLAERHAVAVFIVCHRRKSAGDHADDVALGSVGFVGIARSVWHLSSDPELKTRRLFLPGKSNLAAEGTGLAFSILGKPPAIHWEQDAVAMNADDAMDAERDARARPGPEATVRDDAAEWLRSELSDFEDHPVATIRGDATGAGFTWRTIQRAANTVGVIRARSVYGGAYVWRLPRPGTPDLRAKPRATPQEGENLASWHASVFTPENAVSSVPSGVRAKLFEPGTQGSLATAETEKEPQR